MARTEDRTGAGDLGWRGRNGKGLPRIRARNLWGHLKTVTHHKALVARHCFACGLFRQGLTHDMSKYSPTEFWLGARYFQGYRSPNAAERADRGVSESWLHHKGRNRHHFEYWIDVTSNADHTLRGCPMPTRYVVEMLCDRVAASKVYEGRDYTDASSLEYFRREQADGVKMDPEARQLLERLLTMLAERGERQTFAYVRRQIVRPRATFGPRGRF